MPNSTCKTDQCRKNKAAQNKRYRERNAEKERKRRAKYKDAHREEAREKERARTEGKHRAIHLKKKYGLTLDDYQKMFDKQKGRCAICKTHQLELSRPLMVDHDHATGEVRGLLCTHCNSLLGNACDEVNTLEGAITYLVERGR